MLQEFLRLVGEADSVLLGETPRRVKVEMFDPNGAPDHEIIRISWQSQDNGEMRRALTEQGVKEGRFESGARVFRFHDRVGDSVEIRLVKNGVMLGAANFAPS